MDACSEIWGVASAVNTVVCDSFGSKYSRLRPVTGAIRRKTSITFDVTVLSVHRAIQS